MTATLPQTRHIRLDAEGPVLRVWLNRPDVRNALSAEMVRELQATFDAIRDDANVRVIGEELRKHKDALGSLVSLEMGKTCLWLPC